MHASMSMSPQITRPQTSRHSEDDRIILGDVEPLAKGRVERQSSYLKFLKTIVVENTAYPDKCQC
jgi:hypothetical protein